jgi:hypothetical protein
VTIGCQPQKQFIANGQEFVAKLLRVLFQTGVWEEDESMLCGC